MKRIEKQQQQQQKLTANIFGFPKGTKSTLLIFYSEVSPPPKGLTGRLSGLIDRESTNIFFPKSLLFVPIMKEIYGQRECRNLI